MTDSMEPSAVDPDDLNGHTLDELVDYLDAGRFPRNASIESSPGCQIALESLDRLRRVSHEMLAEDIANEPEPSDNWVAGILDNIRRESRAGRSIPISDPDPRLDLTVTEGSVRGILRAAGDVVPGVLVGRCTLTGDVTAPDEPIAVSVTASVFWGVSLPNVAESLREALYEALHRHTELRITSIDVTIEDVLLKRDAPAEGDSND